MEKHNKEFGKAGEDIAAAYLEAEGYKIIERNYRCKVAEIDLIGIKDGVLVFFEVKTRFDKKFGDPLEAINWRKAQKLIGGAQMYASNNEQYADLDKRIDAIGILKRGDGKPIIEHAVNITV
jgi:putative endonuclease